MYIVENALRNILRNRGRNLLIGAILFTVIVTSVIALMIRNTTSGIIDDYKSRFGAEVKIQPNMQKIRDEAMASSKDGRVMVTVPRIPADQYISFGESEYLKSSSYTASVGVISDSVTAIDAELGGFSGMMKMGGAGLTPQGEEPMQFMMNLLGNQWSEFEDGTRQLASGKMPEGLNEAIISTDLAEENGIKIGDSLSLKSELRNQEQGTKADISYDLKVVGTYYDATDPYAEGAMKNAFTNRRNEILTTYETVAEKMQPEMGGIRIMATYYLKDPGMLEDFAKEVYAKGLPQTFDVTADEASYKKIVGPVEGLKGIATTFMVVVLVFGGIIISLLSSIAIRERKYEIGVLRAMGMKKYKVAFGLWTEMLIITLGCLILGLTVGRLAAQPITDALLTNQIEAAAVAEAAQANGGGMMMLPGMKAAASNAKPLSEIDISLGFDTTMQMVGIALALATLAGLAAIGRITKYEPIKILMERN